MALACLALVVWLALHHPLSAPLALAACALAGAAGLTRPAWALAGLLALMPWVGLMPWTGWIVVEEFDILVLGVAAGGHARIAMSWPAHPGARMRLARVWLWWLPVVVFTAIALVRGVADAGGLQWSWWQGYLEPLNSLRLTKPVIAVTLLLPLWRAAWRADAALASRALVVGMAGMLATTALGVVWERLAFTGLLDFSSDYRATGPFWEMHVGGAALDAVVAVGVPFAVLAWRQAHTPRAWALAAIVTTLGAYAALVTFSRIVYLAVPLGLGCMALLTARQAQRQGRVATSGGLALAVGAGLYLALAWLMFPGAGYRGLLTLLGALALLLPLVHARTLSRTPWVAAAALFALGGMAVVFALSALVPKGAYIAFGLAWALTAAAMWRARRGTLGGVVLGWAGFAAVLAAMPAVALHWGEGLGLERTLPVALLLGVLALSLRADPPWPSDWRWQGRLLGVCAVLSVGVGVFGGGAYMGERMTSSQQDSAVRRTHWTDALSLLRSPAEQLLGLGSGRFVAQHAMSGRAEDQIGDYRLVAGEGSTALVLTGAKIPIGWGQVLRVSQRIAEPAPGPLRMRLRARIEQAVGVQIDVCEKHLLYNAACAGREHPLPAAPGKWQAIDVELTGATPTRGGALAPRLIAFSIGSGTSGGRVEVDDLSLTDSRGTELLANGGFEAGMARWFFSSDHHHMPWHAKNVAVHLLFEQGLLGALAAALLAAAALWRVGLGAARDHPLAPPLAAALIGLLTVGLVDSLLDMPRVAFVAWWLLLMALALPGQGPAGPVRRGAP